MPADPVDIHPDNSNAPSSQPVMSLTQEQNPSFPGESPSTEQIEQKGDSTSCSTPPPTFQCPTCNKSFRTRGELTRHGWIHSKPFQCSTCGKGFGKRGELTRHDRVHSGVKPYACRWPGCEKRFIQRTGLRVHFRIHTGERPNACETCGKQFSSSSSLARHRRTHSEDDSPHPDVTCEICGKSFQKASWLDRHRAKHSDNDASQNPPTS